MTRVLTTDIRIKSAVLFCNKAPRYRIQYIVWAQAKTESMQPPHPHPPSQGFREDFAGQIISPCHIVILNAGKPRMVLAGRGRATDFKVSQISGSLLGSQ